MSLTLARVASPIGELLLAASEAGLRAVYFPNSRHGPPPPPASDPDALEETAHGPARDLLERAHRQLTEYFASTRMLFDLPLDAVGSAFQRRVWETLRAIPYGTTLSYSELARRLGDPRATRAVGAANARNPIPIIVPCHRVVGANGDLTGFGGGLDRKRWLLEHEGALLPLAG